MAEEFNTDGMLDMYLFENEQLLEQLQERVLDQKDADCFDEESINEIFRTMHTIKSTFSMSYPMPMALRISSSVHCACKRILKPSSKIFCALVSSAIMSSGEYSRSSRSAQGTCKA